MSSAAGRVQGASQKVADTTSLAMWRLGLTSLEAVDASQKAVDATSSVITEGSKIGSRKVKDAASSVADSAQDTSKKATDAASSAAGQVRDTSKKVVDTTSSAITEGSKVGSRKARDATISIANGLLAATQGVLAFNLSNDVNALLQKMVAGSATIYDNGDGCRVPSKPRRRQLSTDCLTAVTLFPGPSVLPAVHLPKTTLPRRPWAPFKAS